MIIDGVFGFNGNYQFLSNFYPAEVILDEVVYPTVEHAYQAAKTVDIQKRLSIQQLPYPSLAKKRGKHLPLRSDWEKVKIAVMYDLVYQKFQHKDLQNLLRSTGDLYLEETNYWNDTFWGVCNGKGKNVLGNILMRVRTKINK